MCISPIKIKSPKLKAGTFIQGVDPCELSVPCGHCPECNLKRVNDLVFRAFYEYLDTRQYGFTLFQTLTYSQFHIPDRQGFYFFRKSDVQKFMKRLRSNLIRFHKQFCTFKYLVTSEYGEKHRRPHYHVLFFVRGNITPSEFDKYIKLSWTYLDINKRDKSGKYVELEKKFRSPIGIVDMSSVEKRLVNSIYAIQYICKYIFKGSETWKTICYYPYSYMYRYFMDYVESNGYDKQNVEDYQLVKGWSNLQYHNEVYKDVQLFPFYLQSKNLGMSFLEKCSYEELFDVVNIESNSPLGFTEFHIPNYYIRKVFYDYDKISKRFILNENGVEFKKHVNNETFVDFLETYDVKCQRPIRERISTLLNGRSYNLFAKYCVYLHNRTCPPPLLFLTDYYLTDDNIDAFVDMYQDECMQSWLDDNTSWVYHDPLVLFGQEITHKHEVGHFKLFNDYEIFKDFDKIIEIISEVKRAYKVAHATSIEESLETFYDEKEAKNIQSELSGVVF